MHIRPRVSAFKFLRKYLARLTAAPFTLILPHVPTDHELIIKIQLY